MLLSALIFSRMRAISHGLSPCITDQWSANYPSYVSNLTEIERGIESCGHPWSLGGPIGPGDPGGPGGPRGPRCPGVLGALGVPVLGPPFLPCFSLSGYLFFVKYRAICLMQLFINQVVTSWILKLTLSF